VSDLRVQARQAFRAWRFVLTPHEIEIPIWVALHATINGTSSQPEISIKSNGEEVDLAPGDYVVELARDMLAIYDEGEFGANFEGCASGPGSPP
jgi:hypothetical protein